MSAHPSESLGGMCRLDSKETKIHITHVIFQPAYKEATEMVDYNQMTVEEIQANHPQIPQQVYGLTGYYEGLVSVYLGLDSGEVGWFYDKANRFVVVLSTNLGNIVFFQRYTEKPTPVVYNAPTVVERLLPGPGGFGWEQVAQWASSPRGGNAFQQLIDNVLMDALKELDSA